MTGKHPLATTAVFLNSAALLVYACDALTPLILRWSTPSQPGMHTDYIISFGGPLAYVAGFIRLLPLLMLATGVAIQLYILAERERAK